MSETKAERILRERRELGLSDTHCPVYGDMDVVEESRDRVKELEGQLEVLEKQRVEALSCDKCGEMTHFHTKRLCGKCAPVTSAKHRIQSALRWCMERGGAGLDADEVGTLMDLLKGE